MPRKIPTPAPPAPAAPPPAPTDAPLAPRALLEGDPVACDEWAWVQEQFEAIGGGADTDPDAVAEYCMSVSLWVDATRRLATEGPTVPDGKGGFKPNPAGASAARERKQIRRRLRDLGLLPTTRGTVARFEQHLASRAGAHGAFPPAPPAG